MIWIWLGFILFILLLLALDLGVFNRKAHVISVKEAVGWSAVWIALGLSFSVFVYFGYEHHWLGLGSTVDAVDGTIEQRRERDDQVPHRLRRREESLASITSS